MQLLQRWVFNTTVANLYRFGRRQGKYSRSQQQVTTVWHSLAVSLSRAWDGAAGRHAIYATNMQKLSRRRAVQFFSCGRNY